jgi:hypothetical protein
MRKRKKGFKKSKKGSSGNELSLEKDIGRHKEHVRNQWIILANVDHSAMKNEEESTSMRYKVVAFLKLLERGATQAGTNGGGFERSTFVSRNPLPLTQDIYLGRHHLLGDWQRKAAEEDGITPRTSTSNFQLFVVVPLTRARLGLIEGV